MKPFVLLLLLSFGLASCVTTQVTRRKPSILPPEIQKAQNEVYDLQSQLFQAQHDLAIARINQQEFDLQNQKNTNPGAYSAQYMELSSKLEMERSKIEQRYNLSQQWYNAVQTGDMESAESFKQEMNQP